MEESKDFHARTNMAEYSNFIGDLKFNEIPFILRGTTFTKKIKTDMLGNFKYSFSHGIKLSEMYFIRKVNDYALTLTNIPIVDTNRITYTKKNVYKQVSFSKQLYEIDLTAAYWSLAYREGFLSKELYEEGLRLSKKIRLVALGSLAKQVLIMEFDGYEFTSITKEKLELKANIFFRVSQLTDYYLKTAFLSLGKNALFYWVDALFLQGDVQFKTTCDYFRSKGLDFKFYEIDRITFSKHKVLVSSKDFAEKHNEEDRKREFNFKK